MRSMSKLEIDFDTFVHLVDSLYDEINIWDDNYTLLYINDVCERHYGMCKEEMIGRNYFEFVNQGLWAPMLLPKVYEQKIPIVSEQQTYIGDTIISAAKPIFDEDGNIKYVVSSMKEKNSFNEFQGEDIDINDSIKSSVSELSQSIMYKSDAMRKVIELSSIMSSVSSSTIILGESGVGKSLLAKKMHEYSDRSNKPFININCGAIPKELMESELFGYKEGAFTGAKKNGKKGLLELADGGTVLFDDVSEIPYMLQSKLLQVVQDGIFTPVGSEKHKEVDLKIIVTSNRNLKQLLKEGKFREDLYYRLSVFEIEIPPLRERVEDIEILANFFLNKYTQKYGRNHEFAPGVMKILKKYSWRGNIRELSHTIERLVVTVQDYIISETDLPDYFTENSSDTVAVGESKFDVMVEEYKKNIILNAKKKYKSSRKVAEILNISQSKASRLIRQYTEDEHINIDDL